MMKGFIKICRMTQEELKKYTTDMLAGCGYKVHAGEGYVFAKGTIPVLLTAHLDTVHKEPVIEVEIDGNRISSPQGIGGDDRCGVYIIRQIVTKTKLRPSILFCEDEEVGSKGAIKFLQTKHADHLREMKFMVELDRSGSNDAVFYDCDNRDFVDFVEQTTDYIDTIGTFSDISELAPVAGVAAVNLSCGYYKAHTTKEYVVIPEMENTLEMTKKLLKEARKDDTPQYVYIAASYKRSSKYDYWYGYDNMYDNYVECEVQYIKNGSERKVITSGWTEDQALLEFFIENPDVSYSEILEYKILNYT